MNIKDKTFTYEFFFYLLPNKNLKSNVKLFTLATLDFTSIVFLLIVYILLSYAYFAKCLRN